MMRTFIILVVAEDENKCVQKQDDEKVATVIDIFFKLPPSSIME